MGLRSLEDLPATSRSILDVSKLDRKILVSNADSVVAVHARSSSAEGTIFAGTSPPER